MEIKNFGKKENEELTFELYGVKFYLKQLSFGDVLKFQRSIKLAHEVDNGDADYKSINVTVSSADSSIDFLLNVVKKVEGLEADGEPIDELTREIIEEFPTELFNEIFEAVNEVYAGNRNNKKK